MWKLFYGPSEMGYVESLISTYSEKGLRGQGNSQRSNAKDKQCYKNYQNED